MHVEFNMLLTLELEKFLTVDDSTAPPPPDAPPMPSRDASETPERCT